MKFVAVGVGILVAVTLFLLVFSPELSESALRATAVGLLAGLIGFGFSVWIVQFLSGSWR